MPLESFVAPPPAKHSTFVDLLRQRGERQADAEAFVFLSDGENDEHRLTYGELDRQARAIAAWLLRQNLQGQRALLLYPAGLQYIAAFFGCLYAGVVAVPAYPPRMNRSLKRIQAIADDADARVALTVESVFTRVQPLLDQTPGLRDSIRWLTTDSVADRGADDWQQPELQGDTIAFLQYTSGSTGTPKGVVLSHGNLLNNCQLIARAFDSQATDAYGVFWLPSYHDMGLVGGILQPIFLSLPNVLMAPMSFLQRPHRWLQAISKYRAAISGGPNFAYDLCLRKVTPQQRAKLDLSSWRLAFNGAEPVRAETLDLFAETFGPCGFQRESFYPCYGLAEVTLIASGGHASEPAVVQTFDGHSLEAGRAVACEQEVPHARRLVGAGKTLPGQQIAIVEPQHRTRCQDGEVGEIWISGPSVAQGYWQRPAETEQVFAAQLQADDGRRYLRTGDLGFYHDGELFVAGRLKDLIIIRGVNHYPQDLELTAEHSHPSIRVNSGAAFSVDDEDGARLVIVYEIERRQWSDPQPVVDAIRRDVGREHDLLVDAIVLTRPGSVPKTSSGKIQRHACRAAYLEGSLDAIFSWDARAAAEAVEEEPAEPAEEWAALLSPDADDPPRRVNGHAAAFDDKKAQAIEAVLEEVRRIGKERATRVTLDSNIAELGLDSLERMEIITTLEDRFGGHFPQDVLPTLHTCRDVATGVELYLHDGRKASGRSSSEIPSENYRFDSFPEYVQLRNSLDTLAQTGLENPYFKVHQRLTNDTTLIDGREYVNFSSYNYIGMSGDPQVSRAAKQAIERYGTSVSASRLVSGEKQVHCDLEQGIANFLGVEAAVVFVGGHSTNETTIGHLYGPGDLILHDALAHNSIVQGCILSGARRRPFPHNDWRTVSKLLSELRGDYRRVLVAVEGVYSMDGDMPELPKFIEVCRQHRAQILVDEAHSIGVVGPHGRGVSEYFNLNPADVDLWMGTLSKAFGSCGGYIAGCKAVVEYLKYTAPGFVFSVGLPPANAAAALASLEVLKREPERVARVQHNARLFLELAKAKGLNTGASKDSPVVPIILGNSMHCLQLSRAMARRGVNVQPILHPAVEERAARLRFFITSCHSEEQIRTTVDCLAEELAAISPHYLGQQAWQSQPGAEPAHSAAE